MEHTTPRAQAGKPMEGRRPGAPSTHAGSRATESKRVSERVSDGVTQCATEGVNRCGLKEKQ